METIVETHDEQSVVDGVLDPGDTIIADHPEGTPLLPHWEKRWSVVLVSPDDPDLLYCVPIWWARSFTDDRAIIPDDENARHWFDAYGQDHCYFSVKHAHWFHRSDLIGAGSGINNFNLACDLAKFIRKVVLS